MPCRDVSASERDPEESSGCAGWCECRGPGECCAIAARPDHQTGFPRTVGCTPRIRRCSSWRCRSLFPLTVNLINCPGTPLPCDLSVALGVKQKSRGSRRASWVRRLHGGGERCRDGCVARKRDRARPCARAASTGEARERRSVGRSRGQRIGMRTRPSMSHRRRCRWGYS